MIIADIVGGLRSGLTYGGANSIRELQRKLNYTIVSQAARIESLPHKMFDSLDKQIVDNDFRAV